MMMSSKQRQRVTPQTLAKQGGAGPISWSEIPHGEIRTRIEERLQLNTVQRSAEDALRSIIRRRLVLLSADDHRRFIEREACSIIEWLRATRDEYREHVRQMRRNTFPEV